MARLIVVVVALCLVCFVSSAAAQETATSELSIQYSHLVADAFRENVHANGVESAVLFRVQPKLGIEVNAAGYVYSVAHAFTVMAGPRFSSGVGFAHALVGVENTGAFGGSVTGLAAAAGGGLQFPRDSSAALKLSADYIFVAASGFDFHNIRTSVGVVFRFGRRGESSGAGPSGSSGQRPTTVAPLEAASPSSVSTLGVYGYATGMGFRLTSIANGSPAARGSLQPGNIITRIDGREVHSAGEIDTVVAASSTGLLRVGLLVQTAAVGMVTSEREINLR